MEFAIGLIFGVIIGILGAVVAFNKSLSAAVDRYNKAAKELESETGDKQC